MDNRRLIISVVICIVLLFGWQASSSHMGWIPEPAQPTAEEQAAAQAPAPAPAAPVVPVAKFVPSEGREVRVNTPLYEAVFHSGGGVLQSFRLKTYKASINPDSPLFNMVSPAAATVAPMGLLVNGQPSWNMGQWSFDGSDVNLESGDATLTFVGELNGVRISRAITFHADTYLMDEKVTLTASENAPATRVSYNLGATDFSGKSTYDTMSMAWNLKGSLKRDTDVDDLTKEGVMSSGEIDWAGVMTNYFLSAVLPEMGQNTVFKGRITDGGVWRAAVELQDVNLTAGQPSELKTSWWIGPKSRDLLDAAPNKLKSSIDMGIFTFLAVPLLKLLTIFEEFLGNWGFAIILLTILIKIVLWPLSRKSFKSMEQMKKTPAHDEAAAGKVQERQGSPQPRNDAALQDLRRQPHGRLPSHSHSAARVHRPLSGPAQLHRTASRLLHHLPARHRHLLARRPVREGSALHHAARHGRHHVPAAVAQPRHGRSAAAQDHAHHACGVHGHVHQLPLRSGAVLALQQHSVHHPAVLDPAQNQVAGERYERIQRISW